MRLEGATVLVTGASGGIGAAVTARLAERGARVLAAGRDPGATARAGGAETLVVDLTDPDGPSMLAERAGAVDGIVHAAGVGWKGPLAEMPRAELDRLLALNLRAPLDLTRALLPPMLARRSGRIVLVASIAGLTGVAGESVYAASKAGLLVFGESLRLELAGTGVGVGTVSPGAVDTGFFARRGTPYGRRSPRPLAADTVAAAVVDVLAGRREDVVLPRWLGIAPKVRAVAPGSYRRLARRFG
jgi:short-subunit dehydrogenase